MPLLIQTPLRQPYFTHTSRLLDPYFSSTYPLLQSYFKSDLPILHSYFTSTSLLLHLCFTSTSLVLHYCCTSTTLLLRFCTLPFYFTPTSPPLHFYFNAFSVAGYLLEERSIAQVSTQSMEAVLIPRIRIQPCPSIHAPRSSSSIFRRFCFSVVLPIRPLPERRESRRTPSSFPDEAPDFGPAAVG